jgi:putative membrane protein
MRRTVEHYSSLFTLPSLPKIILALGVLCVLGGVSATIRLPHLPEILLPGLCFGLSLLVVALLSDFIVSRSTMRTDPIFNFRRCSALTAFSWLIWLSLALLGGMIAILVGSRDLWVRMFVLGFGSVLTLRLVVLSAASTAGYVGVLGASILQPALSVIAFLLFNPLLGYTASGSLLVQFPSFSILISVVIVFLFTFMLDRMGKTAVGIASLSLFKAFLANWIADLNAPLERVFEKLGIEKDVNVSLLGFRAQNNMKAIIAIPACHRGPFKNVGSSLLPYLIQDALANKLRCEVSVPHGLFGHETDLSSQSQNARVLDGILNAANFLSSSGREATPFVRVQKNHASGSCQVFGECAIFTLTLAPETTEDLPEELGYMIADKAEKAGVSNVMVINAHNSIAEASSLKSSVDSLVEAASASLEKALGSRRRSFEIGAATVIPKDFGVKDGMGPGGITVLVVKVADQKTAYVTLDGNNMVSGLRETILSTLSELGIIEGEVLTTDTHAVNGVVQTARGYYPVGEAVEEGKLIDYVKHATAAALNQMEPAEALWAEGTVADVKVIGKKQIEQLCLLAEETLSRAKKLAVFLFPLAGLMLTTVALLL